MKTKWIKLTLSADVLSLSDRLHQFSYKTGMDAGFELVSFDNQQVTAKYFERHVLKELIEDPFGVVSEVEMIRYHSIDFSIFSLGGNDAVLMIENPPRSVKGLINCLSSLNGFGFFIDTLNVDINTLILFFRKTFGRTSVKVVSLRANNIILAEKTTGAIDVCSIGDALSDVFTFFKNDNIRIVKAKMSIFNGQKNLVVSASDNGSFAFSPELFEEIKGYVVNLLGMHINS